jgi:hypothetical protein
VVLRQLALQQLALQQSVVSRPLLRIAEHGVGSDNLPKPQGSIRVAGMEVRMVCLDCFAECSLKRLSVVVRTSTEQIIKRFHRYALEQRSESPENACISPTHQ